MNLRSLDLNLLVVFDAIFKERNITKAGTKIGLSQSSVSNALTRLRGHLNDELFLRGPRTMLPTQRAFELAESIHTTLVALEKSLDPKEFDPKNEARIFTIAAVDYFSLVIAPKLARYLEKKAPGIDIRILPAALDPKELLDQGEADFAAGVFEDIPDRFDTQILLEDTFACVVRVGHPMAETTPTVEDYVAAQHLMISSNGVARNFIDNDLEKMGLKRRISMTISSFSLAPAILDSSDLILTAPLKVIQSYNSAMYRVLPSPVASPTRLRHLDLIWHKRLSVHPAQNWFRKAIKEIAVEI